MSTVTDTISTLHRLLIERVTMEKKVKILNKRINQLRAKAYEEMEELGIPELVHDDIKFKAEVEPDYVLADHITARTFDDCEEFMEFWESHDPDVIKIKRTIPWNTRKKLLKDLAAAGEELPPSVKEVYHQTVNYTKTHIEKQAEQRFVDELESFARSINLNTD